MEDLNPGPLQPELEKRLYYSVRDLGISSLTGLTADEIHENMRKSGFDVQTTNTRVVDIAATLFTEGLKYIVDNFEDGTDIKNIARFILNSLESEIYEIDGKVYRKGPFRPILFTRDGKDATKYSAVASGLPVEETEFPEVINVIDTVSNEVVTVDDKEYNKDTVHFVHEAQVNRKNPLEIITIEYLHLPGSFIDRIGENPIEALGDIIQAGSILRDCVLGKFNRLMSQFRSEIYRAELILNFPGNGKNYDLSEVSKLQLDMYYDLMERKRLASKVFYNYDIRLAGLTFDITNLDTGSPPSSIN